MTTVTSHLAQANVAVAQPKQSPIMAAYDRVHSQIDTTDKLIDELEHLIESVMGAPAPMALAKPEQVVATCAMEERFDSCAARVRELNYRLMGMRDRIKT